MFQIGDTFGDYEVIQILGVGGMGQVYKVRNTISDRFEAMKVLLPNLAQHADLADRFLREIKVQAALQHKNIASLHTAQRHGDRILMFIEFVDGMTLDKALQRGPLSPELAANIVGQVLEALQYAHSRGVVHRDIKPENIMLQPDGAVKLMDFGIARLAQDRKLTGTGRTVGSLFYMSPEQIRGAEDLDNRSDLYSLGITLYQCVTGKRPFDGDSDYSIMSAHIQQVPVPPVQLDPRVPAALNDAILMAIAKDRNARFQTADAFRTALLSSVGLASSSGSSAVQATLPLSTLVRPPAAPLPERSPTEPLVKPSKSAESPTLPMGQMPAPQPVPPVQPNTPVETKKGAGAAAITAGVLLAAAALGGGAYYAGLWQPSQPAVEPAPAREQTPAEPKAQAPVTPQLESPRPADSKPSLSANQPSPSAQPTPSIQPAPSAQPRPQIPGEANPQAALPAKPQPQQPAPPIRPNYQQTPDTVEPPRPSAVDPQLRQETPSREMEELRQKFNALSTRFAAAQQSIRSLELQQQSQGFGLRRDIRETMQRFQYLMKESGDSLAGRNAEAARTNLNMAERSLERLEKFLGN